MDSYFFLLMLYHNWAFFFTRYLNIYFFNHSSYSTSLTLDNNVTEFCQRMGHKKDIRQIFCSKCTKYWEKLLLVFWQPLSKLTFWWCTEISPSDSRILELPHDVNNPFTRRESHKCFKYPKAFLSTCFNHLRLSVEMEKNICRGKILWPNSDGCFSMMWIIPCTFFFLPLLILESSKWSAHLCVFYTPSEPHRSLLWQVALGDRDFMCILYFLMIWSWGMRTKDQLCLTLGCKSGCKST